MTSVYVLVALVAIFWGGWPLVSRSAGETGALGTLLLATSALLPIAGMAALSAGSLATPTTASAVRLMVAGVMMGAGLVAYNLVATNPLVEISKIVPIVNTAMLMVTVAGGVWFFTESMTAQKALGVILLVGGIYLLRPS